MEACHNSFFHPNTQITKYLVWKNTNQSRKKSQIKSFCLNFMQKVTQEWFLYFNWPEHHFFLYPQYGTNIQISIVNSTWPDSAIIVIKDLTKSWQHLPRTQLNSPKYVFWPHFVKQQLTNNFKQGLANSWPDLDQICNYLVLGIGEEI